MRLVTIAYRRALWKILEPLDIPRHQLLVAHVRLKGPLAVAIGAGGFSAKPSYRELSACLLDTLADKFEPKGILVPSFTYSFTKNGAYDRTKTPSEVGRFSEEIRRAFSPRTRTMDPFFSFIDCFEVLENRDSLQDLAFGPQSHWQTLQEQGHICLSLNLPTFGTYVHYLETAHMVPYRYLKMFPGKVTADGVNWSDTNYGYYVRDLGRDTTWRRDKIGEFLRTRGVLTEGMSAGVSWRWFHSSKIDHHLGRKLAEDPLFLISD